MGDVGEDYRALKAHRKEQREKNLTNANDEGWNKHTEYHWSRTLNGKRLDYWPSKNKFQYEGRVMCGGIEGFIRNRLADKEKDR